MQTREFSVKGFTATVAEEVVALDYDELPPHVVTKAKHVLLDWLGVTIAGSVEPTARTAQAIAIEADSRPVSRIVGTNHRSSPRDAALANAIAAHALDFDDSSMWADGHPSAVIVSAAIALGEMLESTTGKVVEAIVAGLQGQTRIAVATGPSAYERGFHGTGVYGTFGAAGACARLLQLDIKGLERVYGLAATQTAGLRATFGTMGKHLNAGQAASNGILAAQLAAKEFTAPLEAIEGRQGFAYTHSTTFDPSRPQAVMGNRFAIEAVLFKQHASCHGTHSSIEGIKQLRNRHFFAPEDIDKVQLFVSEQSLDICCISNPQTGLEGKFSVQHAASVALAGRDTGPAAFTDESVQDPHLIALRNEVTVVPQAVRPLDGPTRVVITLTNGDCLEAEVDVFEPTPKSELPMEWEALVNKFIALASPVIGESAAQEVVQRIARLDPTAPINQLIELPDRN